VKPIAIVPAAGLGTRLLPVTRSLPKELLPVGRQTALDWIGAEAIAAGIEQMIIVTSPGKVELFRNHIEAAPSEQSADQSVSAIWHRLAVTFVVQEAPTGLGDAVRIGRDVARSVGYRGPLAVMLPDELHDRGKTMSDLLAAYRAKPGSYIAAFHAIRETLSAYGVLDVIESRDRHLPLRVLDLIEKPAVGEEPSDLAVAGRYLLDTAVLDALDKIELEDGELRLSDAIALAALQGEPVYAKRITSARFDVGSWDGWEQTVSALRR
jgi:UTP--glucose-1-phosphate uridylyltransferase